MKYAFYPGCSLESSAKEYKASTLVAAQGLDIELEEIPEWICCGSTPAHMSDPLLGIVLPSYSLLLARGMGVDGVLVTCASCYSRLKAANYAIKHDPVKKDQVAEALGEPYDGDVPVYHMLELVDEAVGRRLDFLLQEIHREINTMSAKATDTTISAIAVEIKGELEKLREQVQNVE